MKFNTSSGSIYFGQDGSLEIGEDGPRYFGEWESFEVEFPVRVRIFQVKFPLLTRICAYHIGTVN